MNNQSFQDLADAKKRAHKNADRDGACWHIIYHGSSYSHPYEPVSDAEWYELKSRYGHGRNVYTAEPQTYELRLSREELEHYREYLQVERPTQTGVLEGGMFKTPLESGILAKIKTLIGV